MHAVRVTLLSTDANSSRIHVLMNILLQEHLLQLMLVVIPLLLSQVITVEDNTATCIYYQCRRSNHRVSCYTSFATATATDACGTVSTLHLVMLLLPEHVLMNILLQEHLLQPMLVVIPLLLHK